MLPDQYRLNTALFVIATFDWLCFAYVREVWCSSLQGFGWEGLRERDHLEDLGVDGRIILKWVFKKWVFWGGKDWIDMAHDRDR